MCEDSNYFLSPGTCINNTGVFMFKKGCFELGATIYPAVIKVLLLLPLASLHP